MTSFIRSKRLSLSTSSFSIEQNEVRESDFDPSASTIEHQFTILHHILESQQNLLRSDLDSEEEHLEYLESTLASLKVISSSLKNQRRNQIKSNSKLIPLDKRLTRFHQRHKSTVVPSTKNPFYEEVESDHSKIISRDNKRVPYQYQTCRLQDQSFHKKTAEFSSLTERQKMNSKLKNKKLSNVLKILDQKLITKSKNGKNFDKFGSFGPKSFHSNSKIKSTSRFHDDNLKNRSTNQNKKSKIPRFHSPRLTRNTPNFHFQNPSLTYNNSSNLNNLSPKIQGTLASVYNRISKNVKKTQFSGHQTTSLNTNSHKFTKTRHHQSNKRKSKTPYKERISNHKKHTSIAAIDLKVINNIGTFSNFVYDNHSSNQYDGSVRQVNEHNERVSQLNGTIDALSPIVSSKGINIHKDNKQLMNFTLSSGCHDSNHNYENSSTSNHISNKKESNLFLKLMNMQKKKLNNK